jgi:hypothetical protein
MQREITTPGTKLQGETSSYLENKSFTNSIHVDLTHFNSRSMRQCPIKPWIEPEKKKAGSRWAGF